MRKNIAIGLFIIGWIILTISMFLFYIAIETYFDYSGVLMTEAESIYKSCINGGIITLLIGLTFVLIGFVILKRIKKA